MKLDRLFDCEINFPSQFSTVVDKSYGKIFYNLDNPSSYDSNHAVITSTHDIENSLKDIILFYHERSLIPRIYPSFKKGVFETMKPYLQQFGFEIHVIKSCQYFYLAHLPFKIKYNLLIKRVFELDDAIKQLIYLENNDSYTIKVIENNLKHQNFHLLVGYKEDEPVVIATINLMKDYSRIDDVMTRVNHRNKGYCSVLINYLVLYHNEISRNTLYLYAEDKIAKHIYKKNCFQEIPLESPVFNAFYKK